MEVKNEELRLGRPLEAFMGFGRGDIDQLKNVLEDSRTVQYDEIGAGGTWRGKAVIYVY